MLGLSALGWGAVTSAHDFWVQPESYWTIPNAVTSMTLQVGHGPSRQRSPIPARRIIRFEAIDPAGTALDLRKRLRVGGANEDGDFRLEAPGTHVLVLQTDAGAQTHLPSI